MDLARYARSLVFTHLFEPGRKLAQLLARGTKGLFGAFMFCNLANRHCRRCTYRAGIEIVSSETEAETEPSVFLAIHAGHFTVRRFFRMKRVKNAFLHSRAILFRNIVCKPGPY